MQSIAIIPARGGSKRLPRKNILPICGKPIIQWTIDNCIKSAIFERVIVSTDDEEIAKIAGEANAEVVMRPAHMATDEAHEFDAYLHVLAKLESEIGAYPITFCGVYPTAALIEPADYKNAYEKFIKSDADTLMSVTSYDIHPYKSLEANSSGYLQMVYPQFCKERSQTYPHYVASNGTFYFFRTLEFVNEPNYYSEKLVGYELPALRAVDIDNIEDFKFAELVMTAKQRV